MNIEEQKFNRAIKKDLNEINEEIKELESCEEISGFEEAKKVCLFKKTLFPHYKYLLQYMSSNNAYRLLNYFKGCRHPDDIPSILFFYGKMNSGKTTVINYLSDKLEDCHIFECREKCDYPYFQIYKVTDCRVYNCIVDNSYFEFINTFQNNTKKLSTLEDINE